MWLSSIFLKTKFLKHCRISEYSVNFLVFDENFFQKPLENFVCIVRLRSGYVKCSPSPEECSARWIVTIRQKLRAEIEKVKGGKPLDFPLPPLVPMPRFKVGRKSIIFWFCEWTILPIYFPNLIYIFYYSNTGRSSLGKLINWMRFFVLKPLN